MNSSRRLRLILIFMIVLCGVFAYSYGSRLSERNSLEAAIAAEEGRIAAALDRQAELIDEQQRIDSPDYLDGMARDNLDLALPGDKVLVLVRPTPVAATEASQTTVESAVKRSTPPGDVPVWQQWVVFFTDESAVTP